MLGVMAAGGSSALSSLIDISWKTFSFAAPSRWSAQDVKASLHAAFAEADSSIPFALLANHLAGAQLALLQWWLQPRHAHTPEQLAQTFHRLQRAAIRDAFGLNGSP